ncbi:hypothetical protein [uncultured Parasphingorhabdus sp.]|uniref:hypothetical protein n=1 Tax=uncultured Parasphingorhabdus sp. TaxID=2709694 RepID=UPI002AA5FD83|nr:hypothetical protein [uncultured Parasphingorhabdus sp.]
MSMKYLILVAALPLGLTACSKVEDESSDGSSVSIDFSDENKSDSEKINIGGDGEDSKLSIKAEGFSMEIDLPSITLDSDNFDMNDVDLYPGSSITSFDIEDKDEQGGKVRIGFKSPIGADELADWYEKQLTGNDFKVAREGTSLSGQTDEGDPFALALTGLSGKETKGVLEFSEQK